MKLILRLIRRLPRPLWPLLTLLAGLGSASPSSYALSPAAEHAPGLSASEQALRKLLGEANTPVPLRLWEGLPPQYMSGAGPEVVNKHASIQMVTIPTLSAYLPPKEKATGMAIIFCPGGGYGSLAWKNHVADSAAYFVPRGIAVIGLKYRTRPPHKLNNEGIQALTLLDAQRAVRLVRSHAAEWNLSPQRIGVAGSSAGANLAMNLASHFDAGNPQAADPVERLSSRPDFVIGLATWHWREKASPFKFRKDTPPVFMVHALDDGIQGGAPIELPRAIRTDLQALGVPVCLATFEKGGHGAGNLVPQRVKNGFPAAKWPELFLKWQENTGVCPAP